MTTKKIKKKAANSASTPSQTPSQFTVTGPYPLTVVEEQFGRGLDDSDMASFWKKNPELALKKGCYLFAMSKRPFYVGKATKSFKQEVFNHKNRGTYQSVVRRVPGKPAIYLISLTTKKGKPPTRIIGQVEKLLIGMAHDANPRLENVHHKNKEHRFLIKGVYNSGPGKPSKASNGLRSILSLRKLKDLSA